MQLHFNNAGAVDLQEQRYQLGLFLHHKLGLPAFVGYLLGLIS